MRYEIVPTLGAVRKHLTPVQRNSTHYREAPRIGAKTLRRGQKLAMTPKQMEAVKRDIIHNLLGGSIEIREINDEGKVISVADGWDVKSNSPTFQGERTPPPAPKTEEKVEETKAPAVPPPAPDPATTVAVQPPADPIALIDPPTTEPSAPVTEVVPPQEESDKVETSTTDSAQVDAGDAPKKSKKGRKE